MATESCDLPTTLVRALHVRGPADLIQVVPYLLGFRPQNSLIIIGLDRSHVAVTVRIDLADAPNRIVMRDALKAVTRAKAETLVGVVYADESRDRDLAVESLVSAARRAGLDVLDVLEAGDGSWRSLVCTDPERCVCSGGTLNPDDSAIAAAATYAGLTVLPNRDALVAVLDRAPQDAIDAVAARIVTHENAMVQAALDAAAGRHERSVKRALFAAARASDDGAIDIDDDMVARYVVALSVTVIRDAVWMAIESGRLGGRALWVELLRRSPAPYDAAPAFLLAWLSWRSGNGALATAAARRSLDSDPAYGAAKLLLGALSEAVAPQNLPRLNRRGRR